MFKLVLERIGGKEKDSRMKYNSFEYFAIKRSRKLREVDEGNMGSRKDLFCFDLQANGNVPRERGKTIMRKTEQNQIMQKVRVGLP